MEPQKAIEIIKTMEKYSPTKVHLEALDTAYVALRKQIPMDGYYEYDTEYTRPYEFQCPRCGKSIQSRNVIKYEYCPGCGQKMKWED